MPFFQLQSIGFASIIDQLETKQQVLFFFSSSPLHIVYKE